VLIQAPWICFRANRHAVPPMRVQIVKVVERSELCRVANNVLALEQIQIGQGRKPLARAGVVLCEQTAHGELR
jgi:hypothetical protein